MLPDYFANLHYIFCSGEIPSILHHRMMLCPACELDTHMNYTLLILCLFIICADLYSSPDFDELCCGIHHGESITLRSEILLHFICT